MTITGENLPTDGSVEVWFGAAEAAIVSKTSEQIVVTTPAHALEPEPESFDIVSVSITGSQSSIQAGDFYYWQE